MDFVIFSLNQGLIELNISRTKKIWWRMKSTTEVIRHLMSYRQPTICYVFYAWQDMFHFEMNIRKGEMDFLKFNISVFNSLQCIGAISSCSQIWSDDSISSKRRKQLIFIKLWNQWMQGLARKDILLFKHKRLGNKIAVSATSQWRQIRVVKIIFKW